MSRLLVLETLCRACERGRARPHDHDAPYGAASNSFHPWVKKKGTEEKKAWLVAGNNCERFDRRLVAIHPYHHERPTQPTKGRQPAARNDRNAPVPREFFFFFNFLPRG